MSLAIWGSVLESTPELELIEDTAVVMNTEAA